MKKIAIEEHFTTEEHVEHVRLILTKEYPRKEIVQAEQQLEVEVPWHSSQRYATAKSPMLTSKLLDLGEGRLKEMDEAGIDMQVLSLVSPGVQIFDAPTGTMMAKKTNDELSRIVQKYPKRFAGFACLAPQDPGGAADELGRAVKELGLKGAVINSHVRGEYLDEKKYWIILERAAKLRVPIYIHPRSPSPDMIKPYLAYLPLTSAMLGFAAEVSLHAMRLICSGVFDEFPDLKIILGHLGEALPFWITRIDMPLMVQMLGGKIKKKPSQYLRDNFMVTTSGMFYQPALLCTLLSLGAGSILFAVDHPFEPNAEAVQFMELAPISERDKEKICHLNAERLLAL
jgi:5-carboxyvanillate decarboxylase